MPCCRPIDVFNRRAGHAYLVPCGRCDECMQRRKMSYVFRCEQEKLHGSFKYCYFITLTYAPKFLPFVSFSKKYKGSPVSPIETGESLLCPYDLSQFFKRYRLFVNDEVKYFACGEYGSEDNTHRPHYHIIFFCNQDWKACVKYSQLSWSYLVAETLQDRKVRYKKQKQTNTIIKRDSCDMRNRVLIGRVQVKSVTYKRICYIAKYCNKLLFKNEVVKPFFRISNGLGSAWLKSDTAALCKCQNRHFTYFENGLPVAIPRYYSHNLFSAEQMDSYSFEMALNQLPPDGLTDEQLVEWINDTNSKKQSRMTRARLARYGYLRYYG